MTLCAISDQTHRSKQHRYSITSSARTASPGFLRLVVCGLDRRVAQWPLRWDPVLSHILFHVRCCYSNSGQNVAVPRMSASLIGHLRSSTFRLSTTAVSMSLTGSRFSSESAPRPFHYGIRGRGGTIFGSALPLHQRQVQADIRTHLIHRPARDIFPRLGGTRVFSY